MKTILCSIVCCFLVSFGYSQFQRTYGTEKTEVGTSLTQLRGPEKGYLIAGYTSNNFIGGLDATLVKTDLDGNQIWSRVYGGQDADYFHSVRQSTFLSTSASASYVAAGATRSYGFGAGDAFLVGVDTNGAPVFSGVYGGDLYDVAYCVQNIKDENGRPGYIMVGETRSYPNAFPGTNVYVAQTDHMGNLVRATVIGGRGDQRGFWIEQTEDGGYIISGSTTNYWCGASSTLANPPIDLFAIKLKPNLNMEWNRIIGYPKELDPSIRYRNIATCVKQNRQGNYVFTGITNSFGINNSYDAFLLYLSGTGNFLGLKTYGTERRELGYTLEETFNSFGNQSYTIVGQQTIASRKAMLFQTDGGGNLQWARDYGRDGNEGGLELVTDDYDKGFAFTGYTTSFGAGLQEIYLVETTDTGKTGTSCEKEIDLKEIKHEPCITKSAQQIFVDDYRIIDLPVERVEYKEDRCGRASGFKTDDIKSSEIESGSLLFPNPVNNLLTIKPNKKEQITNIQVFDMQGKEIIKNIPSGKTEDITLSTEGLNPGMYIIKLITKNGENRLMKFLKK
ncbi:T9SS type A sorting domain-containing protein [Aquimarina sp. 2201CG5-10]|uniref:T9SS type A sorting domain-containing protein n=1 Tax=Aquimarina callyspongiae TaxID=3098150 RepID=UPI002AB33224|nr:T9SS type A sorting domain-containing protein [Aquimarina sp. 2201CG5-10]MDY8135162.1 T9SS type A sorting domain-containing protein [Aquimarina sp. 2201CG5-10]